MKCKSYYRTVYADKCIWREAGQVQVYFLNIIRIFYEMRQGVITKVGE